MIIDQYPISLNVFHRSTSRLYIIIQYSLLFTLLFRFTSYFSFFSFTLSSSCIAIAISRIASTGLLILKSLFLPCCHIKSTRIPYGFIAFMDLFFLIRIHLFIIPYCYHMPTFCYHYHLTPHIGPRGCILVIRFQSSIFSIFRNHLFSLKCITHNKTKILGNYKHC